LVEPCTFFRGVSPDTEAQKLVAEYLASPRNRSLSATTLSHNKPCYGPGHRTQVYPIQVEVVLVATAEGILQSAMLCHLCLGVAGRRAVFVAAAYNGKADRADIQQYQSDAVLNGKNH
jgi:hypothetical protein